VPPLNLLFDEHEECGSAAARFRRATLSSSWAVENLEKVLATVTIVVSATTSRLLSGRGRTFFGGIKRGAVLAPEIDNVTCSKAQTVLRETSSARRPHRRWRWRRAHARLCRSGNRRQQGAPDTPTWASAWTIWAIATAISRL